LLFAALAAAASVVVSVSYVVIDTDFWQHLAVGRAIWELGRVPTTQLWTWPTYGAPDVNASWGFRVLLWPLWSAFDVWGLYAWRWATTLAAFALGVFFGLGTFYIIASNGLMLGAIFAFTAQHDMALRLFNFVIAHGLVEMSVICIAGAAGIGLGEALVRPRELTRREAFQAASARIGKLLVPCALLLLGCGFIEGYVSPDPTFPLASRVVIGVSYWLLMIALLRGDLLGARRSHAVIAP